MGATTTITAAEFIDAMGVDTHIPYTDGGYADIGKVISDLNYLGISNVRDGITDGQSGSASMASYIALAKAGVKFTIVANDSSDPTPDSIAYKVSLMDRLEAAVPGSVVAVEGANEINNWPVTFGGQTGLDGALALQRNIYSAVHFDPALKGVAVDYFTGYDAGSVAAGPDPSKTSGLADFDTQHPYPKWGEAPAAWLATAQALGNEPTPGPFVYTETGYTTNSTDVSGVNQDVQAKYLLDLYFDAAQDGASKTYVYQLMDAYAPGSPQGDDGYGLFNPDGTAKPAATAIHDLTGILADTGTTAATFTPGTLDYSVSGLPSTGSSMALANSDGSFDIAVWNEPQIWDAATTSETASAAASVTVQFGATYASVSVYDPMSGTAPIETLTDVSAIQLSVTDHPLVIKLGAPAAVVSVMTVSPSPTVTASNGTKGSPSPTVAVATPAATTTPAAGAATDPSQVIAAAPEAIASATTVSTAASSTAISPSPAATVDQTASATPTATPLAAITASPAPAFAVTIHDDGSSTVDLQGSGQTVASSYYDTFLNHGLSNNTFVLDPGFGRDVLRQFRAGGDDHDTISLPSADFAGVADVLRNTRMVSGSAVITDPASGDVVRLAGVTKAQLVHNRADIVLHD